ncbi:hypothetical protein RhiirA5_369039 [Rhizophagus irregularis]|uniref:Uncharacterized protein n=1 Tax=Rhizophagus irregularis TaxID=588596 RepID=A0A2I1DY10_9GLOM|nr:hypothetical protein RhiirA5_369039 [Rhizophagus irregularis]PKC65507.1 hypothetical protein RhiirA1_460956 [Rhizophagus irregularis]PKY14755.1 hypothetical protein RhiirB3_380357 [Rhizophagus irregularis]CAB4481484.1 unnamed protein product [Rhizophagus irregularis]CAB5383416.1 unnamed protein product [Rhizophagus irregularis]
MAANSSIIATELVSSPGAIEYNENARYFDLKSKNDLFYSNYDEICYCEECELLNKWSLSTINRWGLPISYFRLLGLIQQINVRIQATIQAGADFPNDYLALLLELATSTEKAKQHMRSNIDPFVINKGSDIETFILTRYETVNKLNAQLSQGGNNWETTIGDLIDIIDKVCEITLPTHETKIVDHIVLPEELIRNSLHTTSDNIKSSQNINKNTETTFVVGQKRKMSTHEYSNTDLKFARFYHEECSIM